MNQCVASTPKTLYLANPYGFSRHQRETLLPPLVAALEVLGADVWEPFAKADQATHAAACAAYQIAQDDLHGVRQADGFFAVGNGCPPDEGVMVELGVAISLEKPIFLFRDDLAPSSAGISSPLPVKSAARLFPSRRSPFRG